MLPSELTSRLTNLVEKVYELFACSHSPEELHWLSSFTLVSLPALFYITLDSSISYKYENGPKSWTETFS